MKETQMTEELTFAQRLAAARAIYGHTQEQMAEAIRVAQPTVSQWLSGEAEPGGLLQRDAAERYIAGAPAPDNRGPAEA